MKYLSLIELMRVYGSDIKESHCMMHPFLKIVDNNDDADVDCTPFTITQDMDPASGQVFNTLALKKDIRSQFLVPQPPLCDAVYTMPPILEIEWLKDELDLDDENVDALQMIGYMHMLWVLQGSNFANELNHYDPAAYMRRLESLDAVIEVEDVSDTAKILMARPLPFVRLPVIRSYNTSLMYGTDFVSIFNLCNEMAYSFKEMYLHLPVMLSLFMRDIYGCKLSNWSKANQLNMEDKLKKMIAAFDQDTNCGPGKLSYSLGTVITQDDVELVRFVLTLVYDKLHELNADVGTVSYRIYKRVSGPDMTMASVRLWDMDIRWEEEMRRAEEEKKVAGMDGKDEQQ